MAKTTRTKKKKKAAARKGAAKTTAPVKGKQEEAPAKAQPKKKEKDKGGSGRTQKSQATKSARTGTRERTGVGKFLREVRVEMSKVTWPTREELTQSTIVVFIAIAVAAVYIAIFDQLFTRLVELIS